VRNLIMALFAGTSDDRHLEAATVLTHDERTFARAESGGAR